MMPMKKTVPTSGHMAISCNLLERVSAWMCMFLILCCFGSCRQPQDGSLICLFFLLGVGSSSEQWGGVLKGCAGWFCSLTN